MYVLVFVIWVHFKNMFSKERVSNTLDSTRQLIIETLKPEAFWVFFVLEQRFPYTDEQVGVWR